MANAAQKIVRNADEGSLHRKALALIRQGTSKEANRPERVWEPQPGPQTALVKTYAHIPEIGYGGARGGGKTDGALGDFWTNQVPHGAGVKGAIFRRTAMRLEEVESRARELFLPIGAKWNGSTHTLTFREGQVLMFRHLKNVAESEEYKGYQLTWACFEQLEEWPEFEPVDRIRAAMRSARGIPIRMMFTFNPGGVGHSWVKARFIDPARDGYTEITDPRTGISRMFVPAKMEDNPALMDNDPTYRARVESIGNEALRRGWVEGNWDIAAGGYFQDVWMPDIDRGIQELHPFMVPPSWRLLRSFDWGFTKPASLGLYAVSDGMPISSQDAHYPGKVFPPGSYVRIGEWYTCQKDDHNIPQPNKGLRISNVDLGYGVAERSGGRSWSISVADPSIFTSAGDESIYDRMREGSRNYYVRNPNPNEAEIEFQPANNDRVSGWQKLMVMLQQSSKERPEDPGFWVVSRACPHWLRTVPVLPMDTKKPDDIDTDSEDHAADETRYAVMATEALTGYSSHSTM